MKKHGCVAQGLKKKSENMIVWHKIWKKKRENMAVWPQIVLFYGKNPRLQGLFSRLQIICQQKTSYHFNHLPMVLVRWTWHVVKMIHKKVDLRGKRGTFSLSWLVFFEKKSDFWWSMTTLCLLNLPLPIKSGSSSSTVPIKTTYFFYPPPRLSQIGNFLRYNLGTRG